MEALYHYCSSEAFLSIVKARSLWLSSLSLSNDYREGKIVSCIIDKLATEERFSSEEKDVMQNSLDFIFDIVDGFGFCMSEKKDLLSQWRGYANDATGFSVGFSVEYLRALCSDDFFEKNSYIKISKVLYDSKDCEDAIAPVFHKIKELVEKEEFGKGIGESRRRYGRHDRVDVYDLEGKVVAPRLSSTVLRLLSKLFVLKSDAFHEEKEWRLIYDFFKKGNSECSFRVVGNRIIPYKEINLIQFKMVDIAPIVEVVIGPKNMTPLYVIKSLLEKNGFANVEVSRSNASYQ